MVAWLWWGLAGCGGEGAASDSADPSPTVVEGDADADTDADADPTAPTTSSTPTSSTATTPTSTTTTAPALCVADDVAGTTWDEAAGITPPWVPVVTYTGGLFDGIPVLYEVPPAPVAVIFAFHGAGGGVGDLTYLEWSGVLNELLQAGFAVVATESNGREWNTGGSRASNADLDRVIRWRDTLIDTTDLEPTTPVFAMGFSNGGNFAGVFLDEGSQLGWDVRAASIHNSDCLTCPGLPVVWTSSANDTTASPTGIANRVQDHLQAGQDALLLEVAEEAFSAVRMQRHPAYDATEAQAVFDDLVAFGVIDAAGARVTSVNGSLGLAQDWSDATLLLGPDRVVPQLETVWATHRFNGARALEECAFLVDYL